MLALRSKLPTRDCPVSSRLEGTVNLCRQVEIEIVEAAKQLVAASRSSEPCCRPVLGLIKLGIRWWRILDFVALKTDKDGGFCVLTNDDYKRARLELFSLRDYCRTNDLDGSFMESLCLAYRTICLKLS